MNAKRTTLFLLSLVAGAQIWAGTVRAGEVCDTIESCHALQGNERALLAELLNGAAPRLTDVVKSADGRTRAMSQFDADQYCRSQGERLPTARELALYAQSSGAKGISSVEKDDYYQIAGLDSTGHWDSFYYSPTGYRRPNGELENYWSSTTPSGGSIYAYVLENGSGGFGLVNRGYSLAVRCVRSR